MTYKLPNEAGWVGKTKEPPSGHKDCLKQAQDIFKKAEKVSFICWCLYIWAIIIH